MAISKKSRVKVQQIIDELESTGSAEAVHVGDWLKVLLENDAFDHQGSLGLVTCSCLELVHYVHLVLEKLGVDFARFNGSAREDG